MIGCLQKLRRRFPDVLPGITEEAGHSGLLGSIIDPTREDTSTVSLRFYLASSWLTVLYRGSLALFRTDSA